MMEPGRMLCEAVAALGLWMAAPACGQSVLLDQTDLVETPQPGVYIAPGLKLPVPDPSLPVVGPDLDMPGTALLRRLVASGRSQGFGGILYDNRDRGHSDLPRKFFPQLTYVSYGPVLRYNNWDYGLELRVVIPQPLIGNSSTALTRGPKARSQTRMAMTTQWNAQAAFRQYAGNSLYVYPEHRDHDARDLYPANWPYTVNSQGSSSSDKLFVRALLMTLAAFPADTRAALEQRGLIAPALQMIMRRNLVGVETDAAYMSARANPTAIDRKTLRPDRMIAAAAAMKFDEIPPMVRLAVESEDFSAEGGLLIGRDERLFTTPSAVARLWRGPQWRREMVVSVEGTEDPNGRPLRFHWRVLRGHPQKVEIDPLDAEGRRARISVMWHDDYPAPPLVPGEAAPRLTSRVDIGVFADNGRNLSAPGFVSISFPTHQKRQYGPAPDGSVRLLAIDYDAEARGVSYDPMLYWSAPWTDRFDYAEDGSLLGWTRSRDGKEEHFLADGKRADGRQVDYVLPERLQKPMLLSERVSG